MWQRLVTQYNQLILNTNQGLVVSYKLLDMEASPLFVFILLVFLDYREATVKQRSGRTWQSNLNFNNSLNWDIGRVPCEADRLVLPKSEGMVLELPGGRTTLRAIALPESSEIVLPSDGMVQFSGRTNSPTCQGKDAVFKHTEALRWLDASNWDGWNKATPDLERVPCTDEVVWFPSGATYNILTPETVLVGSLGLNGVVLDTVDWFTYSKTNEHPLQFRKKDGSPADILILNSMCESSSWCDCENSYLQYDICTYACPVPLCKQPVQPYGFCCPLCGAYIHLQSSAQDGNHSKNKSSELINNVLKDKGVVWHASYINSLSQLQLVLVQEKEYSEDLSAVAEELKESLLKSGLWRNAKTYLSGHVWYPSSFGQVVGHFFSLMVFAALTIAILTVFTSKEWAWMRWLPISPFEGRPYLFARFENQTGEVVVCNEERPDTPALPQAFDNPMYGATKQEQRNVTVENPMYTELEETASTSNLLEDNEVTIQSTDFSE